MHLRVIENVDVSDDGCMANVDGWNEIYRIPLYCPLHVCVWKDDVYVLMKDVDHVMASDVDNQLANDVVGE